jgi:glutathione synthase/RimK-type ligase-like ATP-grasp enzyme
MSQHVIVVDRKDDFTWGGPDRTILTAQEYINEPPAKRPKRCRIINLCHDYSYLSLGYYCSLLAEARGEKVIPSVNAMLDLGWKRLYSSALAELNELVRKAFARRAPENGLVILHIYFGGVDDPRLEELGRRLFDLFRSPVLEVEIRARPAWEIVSIQPLAVRGLTVEQMTHFQGALDHYTHRPWKPRRTSPPSKYSLAVLYDPEDPLPPSNRRALEKFIKVGAPLGVSAELITRKDYGRLSEFDALFLRETTALDDHTYRFARKAEAEGMPVIDRPASILRCTNKVYLAELLRLNGVPTPRTVILDRSGLRDFEAATTYPVILKIPDGSFSRGVFKALDGNELNRMARSIFKESDVILAQEYVYTDFDWRVGVLNHQPIFVCQYFMRKNHWQIVKHGTNGRYKEGRWRTLDVSQAPEEVVATAVRAANLIGDGLYGVDLKETPRGVMVLEINDNPNLDAGVEDQVLKDELYRIILREFVRRLEARGTGNGNGNGGGNGNGNGGHG